ncbi:MAG: hypothetical protein PVS3B3_07160 [Ktedonobacteraceae bacterium]
MQTWLFVLVTVGKKPSNEMDDKIGWAAVTRMLNLRDILELVDDRVNDGPFTEQQLIGAGTAYSELTLSNSSLVHCRFMVTILQAYFLSLAHGPIVARMQ